MYHDYEDGYDCDCYDNDCDDCEAYHEQRWREYKKKKTHKERDKEHNNSFWNDFWDDFWYTEKDKQ